MLYNTVIQGKGQTKKIRRNTSLHFCPTNLFNIYLLFIICIPILNYESIEYFNICERLEEELTLIHPINLTIM